MKKTKPSKRGSTMKGGGAPKTIDEYLARVPEPARSTLEKIRAMVRSAAPPEAGRSHRVVWKYVRTLSSEFYVSPRWHFGPCDGHHSKW